MRIPFFRASDKRAASTKREQGVILSVPPSPNDAPWEGARHFPGYRVIEVRPEDLPLSRPHRMGFPFVAVRELIGRRHRVVIVSNDCGRLKVLAMLARTDRRVVVDESGMADFGWSEIVEDALDSLSRRRLRLRLAAERKWMNIQVPSPVGPGNDYNFIARRVQKAGTAYRPHLLASVLVPVYNRREALEKTLAGLALQTYPKALFEVIVADDGSSDHPEEVAERFRERLNIRTVQQADEGFRLAAVRNLAIGAARGEVILSLDCDMLPEPQWLAAHMSWFHAYDGPLLTIGLRTDIDTSSVLPDQLTAASDVTRLDQRRPAKVQARAPRPADDWRLPDLKSTRWLRDHPHPYRLASGGNVAFRKRDAEAAGLFDESFRAWGGEDLEFAYRLYRRGAYLIPDARAFAYHQTHPISPNRETHKDASRQVLGRKVPFYRRYSPNGEWEVPKVSVYMPAHNAAPYIQKAVESALTQTLSDLEVCICNDGSTDETEEILARHFRNHPRVRWVSQARGGVGSASARAVSLCRGEYILQLDADDELLPRAAEVLADELDRHPQASLVCGGYQFCNAAGEVGSIALPRPYSALNHLVSMVIRHPRMFRARDFHRTSGFEGRAAVDFDISLKLAERGEIRTIPEVLYRYRVHGENLSIRSTELQSEYRDRAIREALLRRGLDWHVVQDPESAHRLKLEVPPYSLETMRRVALQTIEERLPAFRRGGG